MDTISKGGGGFDGHCQSSRVVYRPSSKIALLSFRPSPHVDVYISYDSSICVCGTPISYDLSLGYTLVWFCACVTCRAILVRFRGCVVKPIDFIGIMLLLIG